MALVQLSKALCSQHSQSSFWLVYSCSFFLSCVCTWGVYALHYASYLARGFGVEQEMHCWKGFAFAHAHA